LIGESVLILTCFKTSIKQTKKIPVTKQALVGIFFALIVITYGLSPSSSMATQTGDKITFENLTVDHGLSQSSVFAILQDKQGMMWFGTWDGLNRYDGYRFTTNKHNDKEPQSLSNNEIWTLYEDSQGILRVGTMEGLDQFDREKDRFIHYPHDPENPASLAGNRVHAIAKDKKAMLWIGTQDGGLSKFDRHTGQFQHYQHNLDNTNSLSQQDVIAIFEDHQM